MDEHITSAQAIMIITTTRLALAISSMPTVNLPPYNQDMWFMNLLSIVYTLIMFIPLLFLANRFNNFTITGYLRIIYGKTLGGIIIVLYGLYFLMNSVNGLTILGELITSTVLPRETNYNIIIFITLVMFYAITRGTISGARVFQILAPLSMAITIGLILLGLNNVDLSLLRPVLRDSSIWDINRGAILLSLYFSDIFILLMIIPELERKKSINKITITSVIISMAFLAVIVIVSQTALGIEQSRHSNSSFLLYVRLIDAFDQFERIDSIFIVGWLITSIGRNAGFLFISVRTIRELFNKKEDDRIILTVVSILVAVISIVILSNRSVIGIRKYFDQFYNIQFLIFAIIIPIITCVVYFFRRKTLRRREPSHNLVDKLD